MKRLIVVLVALSLIFTSSMAFADKNNAVDVIADTFVLRILGFATLVGGSVAYVVSLPIAAVTKSTDTTSKIFVKDPYEYTFKRPIGEVESNL
ncbi:MAG: hypothetical protein JSU90_07120 [Nitrospiraceae bacterium]|nr:MAG: hypothetical protein JSU90_07120 [Nitrospiraceae bacterium]